MKAETTIIPPVERQVQVLLNMTESEVVVLAAYFGRTSIASRRQDIADTGQFSGKALERAQELMADLGGDLFSMLDRLITAKGLKVNV